MNSKKYILIKAYLIGLLLLVFGVTIMVKMFLLQNNASDDLKEFAMKANHREKQIKAQRGNLYASDGSLLAISVSKYDVYLDMVTVKKALFNDQLYNLSDSLGMMFNKPTIYYQKLLTRSRVNNNQYLKLAGNIGYFDLMRLKQFPILEKGQIRGGLIVNESTKRVFPMSRQIGLRTIGYDDPKKGQAGLEGAYSQYLRGINGSQYEQRINGNNWKPINIWTIKEPVDGSDVYTTIDIRLQEIAYNALEKQLIDFSADHGSVVLMEVDTGEVKAIVNLARGKKGSYVDNYNFAVGEANEPGSCIKLASLMTAIEHGYVNINTMVDTGNGVYRIYDRRITDSHSIGVASVGEIFKESSNVGVAKIVQQYYKKNPRKFIKQWKKWKLNEKLDIDIPGEATPVIPYPGDDNWSLVSLPWMSYGYSTKLTPLQILTFYNGVANDGKMLKPLFIKKIVSRGQKEKIFKPEIRNEKMASPETIKQVKSMMQMVVEDGTGKGVKIEGYPIAGKTSTVLADYWIKNQPKKYRSSFVGYFPADKPKYSCIVVIHKPDRKKGYYGGIVAGPVFKAIAEKVFLETPINANLVYKNSQEIKNEYHVIPSIDRIKKIPNLKGVNGMESVSKLENLGMNVFYTGVGKVINQSLPAGSKVEKGQRIYLELNK